MYTFAGSANDVVTIRPRKISGSFTPYLELYSPSGSRIAASAIEIRMTLPASGTYVVLVMDYYYYLYTGDYLLYLEKLNNPSNVTATLSCEQVVSGSIGTFVDPPPWKIYRFTVSANESVTIRTRRTSGTSFSPQMELYNPSGTYLVAGSEINTTLAVAGTYTIIVRDANNAYAGNFSLSWRRVVNPCTSTPLNCGRVLSGSISASDEIDTYTFTGLVNDVVNIRILNSSGGAFYPILDLYGPTGSWVTGGGTAIARRLTASGTYAVLVRDNSNVYTGNYILALVRMSDSCGVTALGCSEVVSGSIGTGIDPPPWRHYNLMASANDVVTIRMTKTSGNISPQIELYNPGGAFIAGGSGQIDRTLTAAGTYTIVARDYNNSSGTYILTWLRVKNPHNARAISCGQVLQGTLSNPGETDAYTFTAAAGDNVALTMTRTSGGLDPSLELYNSSGTRIAYQSTCSGNQIAINQVLSAGTYTVLAYDCANDEVGNYTLKFQRNNNSCPEVTVIAPNGGEAIPAWSIITIRWSSIDLQGISSQEIRLSTDGGQTFPTVIASGLQGSVQTYDWSIPGYLATRQGRIRVTVTDTSGISTPDDSDGNFSIHGAARQYVYDELNRLRQVIYEDGRTITYTYDAAGNRITLRNER
jgi:YD repeat-containing protein